jgi:tRNA pseudouridine38-40 synthase
MKKYKLTISYDGTAYAGWQIQKNKNTIQEEIQKALKTILREDITIVASGRTDTKVHALGQVAHCSTKSDLNLKKILYSLNSILPSDIKIIDAEEVDLNFHARFSAKSKIYQYHIATKTTPFTRYAYVLNRRVDLTILKKAIEFLIGKHDFRSFANKQNKGPSKNKPIKNLKRIDVIEKDDLLILEFEADGFLYKMVRNISQTLIDIATKKIPLSSIETILNSKDRKNASSPAEPQGLFLVKVIY